MPLQREMRLLQKAMDAQQKAAEQSLKPLREQSERIGESLEEIGRQLNYVSSQVRLLDDELRPFEETLQRAEAAASLIVIPLQRQLRALQKNLKEQQKIVEEVKKRHAEENKALEEAIRLAELRLEKDRERLQNLDWELFIEQTKNKIWKQETSARELALKTEKLIMQDSVEQQEIALERMKEQLEEQKKRQELEVEAAEKQIEAAEAMIDAVQMQIDAAQEVVTYAQEELELRRAMQVEQRIAIDNQRRVLELAQEAMQRQKDELSYQQELLKEKEQLAKDTSKDEADEVIPDSTAITDANAKAVEELARDLTNAYKMGMEATGEAMPGYVGGVVDKVKAMPLKDTVPAAMINYPMSQAEAEAMDSIITWVDGIPMKIQGYQLRGKNLPTVIMNTGWDSAKQQGYLEIDEWWDKPEQGVLAIFADKAKEAGEIIADGIAEGLMKTVTLPKWLQYILTIIGAGATVGYENTPASTDGLARGFEGMVDRPRQFLVGEAGPEYVQVTPMSGMIHGGTGVGVPVSRMVSSSNVVNNTSSVVNNNNYNVSGVYGQTPSERSIRSELELSAHMYH